MARPCANWAYRVDPAHLKTPGLEGNSIDLYARITNNIDYSQQFSFWTSDGSATAPEDAATGIFFSGLGGQIDGQFNCRSDSSLNQIRQEQVLPYESRRPSSTTLQSRVVIQRQGMSRKDDSRQCLTAPVQRSHIGSSRKRCLRSNLH